MEEIKDIESKTEIVKPLMPKVNSKPLLFVLIGLIVLGILTGFGAYAWKNRGTVKIAGQNVEVVKTPTEEGVQDAATFKDTATGNLIANDGKITTEGTDILVRPGGVSQNVYLTSAVVDLSKYEGKNVQVWGQTFQGRTAGWLMDVGRIKVVQ